MVVLEFIHTLSFLVGLYCLSGLFWVFGLFLNLVFLMFVPLACGAFMYLWIGVNLPWLGLGLAVNTLFTPRYDKILLNFSRVCHSFLDQHSSKRPVSAFLHSLDRATYFLTGWFGVLRKLLLVVLFSLYILFASQYAFWRSSLFRFFLILSVGVTISGITMSEVAQFLIVQPVETFGLVKAFMSMFYLLLSSVYKVYESHKFRRTAFAVMIIRIINIMHAYELIVYRYNSTSGSNRRIKISKILRSMSLAFSKYVDGVRLPSMFRNPLEAGFSEQDQKDIASVVDGHLDYLRAIGYPVSEDVHSDDPVVGLLDGKFDHNWLFAGSNWRIHAPQLVAYAQPEFRKFQVLIEEYRPSFTYMNLENQLESISRYFSSPDIQFPEPADALDVVWPIVKDIFWHSRITPAWAIYKSWNKRFNVGVFSISKKRNRYGGFKKKSRREWIAELSGPRSVISVFENFVKFGLIFDTYGQFFTKKEWLKPKKWINNVVRTPVAMMLPAYVAQMVVSADPNKRYEWKRSPIKLGMPLNNGTFERIWAAHSRFNKHFAGDLHNCDSTFAGPLIRLIKAVRAKGFESHKDYKRIEKILDRVYDNIEHAKLVSAQSGNVYKKGSGLATGHASTSLDNSLAMVALYLVCWKALTGRSAEEFRAFNELTCYGDDHVLSIADHAPPVWNWNNIVKQMASWGIDMYEEIPTDGRGAPLDMIPFLKKYCRTPNADDRASLLSVFGSYDAVPAFVTYHDPKSLLGKALSAQTNKNPRDRAKRLQSFLYLCAFNRKEYDIIHEGIQVIFKNYPNVKKELSKYTPSYNRTIQVFMTEKTKKLSDLDSDVLEDFDEGKLVIYGEVTILESFFNGLANIVDYPNPAIRNLRPLELIMQGFGECLSWPKAFLSRSNLARTVGHVEMLVGNSSYDWLAKTVPHTHDANMTSLYLRHWVYMCFNDNKSYSFWFYVNGFFSKVISLNFIVTGYIAPSRPKWGMSFRNLFLVALLSFVNVPSIPLLESTLARIKIPDIAGKISDTLDSFISLVLHQLPTSFNDVGPALVSQDKFIVSAPTGTGKSTSLIQYIHSLVHDPNRQIFVCVPRVSLAIGLSNYMNSQWVTLHGHITGESVQNELAPVVYITYGSMLERFQNFVGHGHVFICDEFHVPEVEVQTGVSVLEGSSEKVLFVSATPKPLPTVDVSVDLVVSATFSVDTRSMDVSPDKGDSVSRRYLWAILNISRAHNPWMRHLIFVDSFAEMDALEQALPGTIGTISSKGLFNIDNATYILATSTADVGVTIPNVDIVISKDISWTQGPKGLAYYKMSDSLTTQRRGRTGRTNNGVFYLLSFAGTKVQPAVDGFSTISLIISRLNHRLAIAEIFDNTGATYFPEFEVEYYDIVQAILEDSRPSPYSREENAFGVLFTLNNMALWFNTWYQDHKVEPYELEGNILEVEYEPESEEHQQYRQQAGWPPVPMEWKDGLDNAFHMFLGLILKSIKCGSPEPLEEAGLKDPPKNEKKFKAREGRGQGHDNYSPLLRRFPWGLFMTMDYSIRYRSVGGFVVPGWYNDMHVHPLTVAFALNKFGKMPYLNQWTKA